MKEIKKIKFSITLLNTFHQILSTIIQQRLIKEADNMTGKTNTVSRKTTQEHTSYIH